MIGSIKNRNYRFIIFIDDLAFEENEVEYKFLKAVIEGGVETRPENVLIYATSNRRHLVKETGKDRNDMEHEGDIHRSDTIEEKTSLSARFGVSINYNAPTPKQYHEIVKALAERNGLKIDEAKLKTIANSWEIRHGGFSGSCLLYTSKLGVTDKASRDEVIQLVNIFKAKVIDVDLEAITIWVFGDKEKNEALIKLLGEFGILEIAKTGTIAIERGRSTIYDDNKLQEEFNYGKNVL